MGFVFYAPFGAWLGIILNRTKLCFYEVKERDVLNVVELLKDNQTWFPWVHEVNTYSEKKQPTHTETGPTPFIMRSLITFCTCTRSHAQIWSF